MPIRKMKKTTRIHFENNLLIEKRNMNVYHGLSKGTHFISHGSSVEIQLRTMDEDDYINLSVAVGPGFMERSSIVDLPSWLNYEFRTYKDFSAIQSGGRVRLKISAGLPEWQLILKLPASSVSPSEGRVIISDDFDE